MMILENLEELIMKRNHVKVRMPMLKGINDSEAEIRGVIEFLKPFREFISTTLLPIDSVLPIISNMQVDIFVDNQPLDLQCFCEVLQINYGN